MQDWRFCVFAGLASLTACDPATAQSVTGLARAKDGDSLMVGNQEVRLHGIDAPEFNQSCTKNGQSYRCGQAAYEQLSKLVTGRTVKCVSMGVDKYDRVLGRCSVNGSDVNQRMVASGHAVAFRRFSMAYVSAENSAKLAKRGLWAGEFAMPSDYRDEQQVQSLAAPLPGRDCRIKGNRGSNGWIYHMPGQKYYARTKPEEMFCSEAEAKAAGYRKARTK